MESSPQPGQVAKAAKLRADTGAIRMSLPLSAHRPIGRSRAIGLENCAACSCPYQKVQHAAHQGDIDALPFAGARTLYHRRPELQSSRKCRRE